MRKYGKVDANQTEIVRALRGLGASVQSLSSVGNGCPDLLVGYRGRNFLIEVKAEDGSLNNDQSEWIIHWKGPVPIIARSAREAVDQILGAV